MSMIFKNTLKCHFKTYHITRMWTGVYVVHLSLPHWLGLQQRRQRAHCFQLVRPTIATNGYLASQVCLLQVVELVEL